MGGFGSGRDEYADTPTVERCHHLSADRFAEHLSPGATGAIRLTWNETTNIVVRVVNDVPDDVDEWGDDERPPTKVYPDAVRLVYTSKPPDGDEREHDYRVPITYTEPTFDGRRPWWECPACGTRRGKLYLPPAGFRFACRECHELGYQSSRSSGNRMDRALQRYRKAFARADAENRRPHPEGMPVRPDRPTGMHHATFEDLLTDVREARDEWYAAFRDRARELAGGEPLV